jgi:predicted RNA-binding Zn-ribbon protein involved in translation (DUF1610 family)
MDYVLLGFIIIILYVFIIFILKYIGIGSKKKSRNSNNSCPDCKENLNRIKRIYKDKIIFYLTLGILDWKRYSCEKCGWEGLRWPKDYKP